MGEVYRARDIKLNRDVAMKVLPEAFTRDPDRLARFRREAQVLASLNHPNIAAIYGFEESTPSGDSQQGAVQALVLELVDGPTLADRTAQGPIPLIDALRIAKQIAEALEASHEQGIVHRDLKPANIKVRADGTVKVLVFGLAKIAAVDGGGSGLSHSPTMTAAATRHGVILGTVAYMSPEQARGKPLDKRTDIWSLGCVLYEMLTGRSAFAGESVSDTIVAVLEREPDWNALPQTTSPAVRRLLQRCFEKDARRRLHDAADVRIEIEDALAAPASGGFTASDSGRMVIGSAPSRSQRDRLWLAAIAAMAVAIVVLSTLVFRRPAANLRPLRLSIVPPAGTMFTPKDISGMPNFAMSADGNRLAFVASAPGAQPQLWVQQLDSAAAQPLPGTDDAAGPFWSPDSRSLAFYARGKLKKVSLGGGVPQDLVDIPVDVNSGAWNANGIILFGGASGGGALFRVSAEGGPAVPVTKLDPSRFELTHRWPQFLPDGRRFIFHALSAKPELSGVFLGSLDGGETRQIVSTAVNAVYAASGHLLFDQAGTLMVQPFDPEAGTLRGQASAFGDRVLAAAGAGHSALSRAADGTGAYSNRQAAAPELLCFDRSGRRLGKAGATKPYQSPALSPDAGSLLISEQISPSRTELWSIDLSSGVPSRLTFPAGEFSFARFGIWSPDGKRLIYSS